MRVGWHSKIKILTEDIFYLWLFLLKFDYASAGLTFIAAEGLIFKLEVLSDLVNKLFR